MKTVTPAKPQASSKKQITRARRTPVSQTDLPRYTVLEAMRVAEVIRDNFAMSPTKPLHVASAMQVAPTTGGFKMLTGAAVAYGLCDGGAQAGFITVTALGKRAVAPLTDGDDSLAVREAALTPRVLREFLRKYDGSPFPVERIALNVLHDMNVPQDSASRAWDMIRRTVEELALGKVINGKTYVDLSGVSLPAPGTAEPEQEAVALVEQSPDEGTVTFRARVEEVAVPRVAPAEADSRTSRVFITHGSNLKIVEQIKEVVKFSSLEPVVSIEKEAVAKPVPDKVMDDMRSCGSAIVHVGTERKLMDETGTPHAILNSNVLIEIGAAMALYGKNFILLVEDGTELPSNLRGLYEVRYSGGELSADSLMKLLKAFNEIKAQSAVIV